MHWGNRGGKREASQTLYFVGNARARARANRTGCEQPSCRGAEKRAREASRGASRARFRFGHDVIYLGSQSRHRNFLARPMCAALRRQKRPRAVFPHLGCFSGKNLVVFFQLPCCSPRMGIVACVELPMRFSFVCCGRSRKIISSSSLFAKSTRNAGIRGWILKVPSSIQARCLRSKFNIYAYAQTEVYSYAYTHFVDGYLKE